MTWLDRSIVALDTETTGTDPETARIITACIGLSPQPGEWEPDEYRINPGVPIPPESTAVHGIKDADVADWGDPIYELTYIRDRLELLADYSIPVVGWNLTYDLTLLDRELRRHLGADLPDGLLIIDGLVLWRRLDQQTGGRRLSQLAERHGIIFPAHDATADALASLRLLHILASRHDYLGEIPVAALQHLQARWYAAQVESAYQARLGRGDTAPPPDTHWPLIPADERTPS